MTKQNNNEIREPARESPRQVPKQKRRLKATGAQEPKPDTMRAADVANGENPET
jgi:hypothetical protein